MSKTGLYQDQMNRQVSFSYPPKRIVSIVPSLTEYLWDLGLRQELAGRTRFCIHPAGIKEVPDIGGTKKLHIQKILDLHPDLVIGNKEENEQSQVEELSRKVPVWMSDIQTVDDCTKALLSIGDICGKPEQASVIVNGIKSSFDRIHNNQYPFSGKTAAYFIWKKPWMTAGKNTFIDEILKLAGFVNCVEQERYPQLSSEEFAKLDAEYILLSSEPYPFKKKDIEELSNLFPKSKVMLVDGEMFSWYGSRLLKLEHYLARMA